MDPRGSRHQQLLLAHSSEYFFVEKKNRPACDRGRRLRPLTMRLIGPYPLKNPYLLAPMAGVSEMPFRVLALEMGAALCPTELVSAQGLMRANSRTLRYLRHDSRVEHPYSLQIFGGEPEVMAQAALIGQQWGAQIIDINMGCPVKKVTKSGAGSALLCDPIRAGQIVRAIRQATGLPVTAKIRSGWDHSSRNYLDVAGELQAAGCAALAVHPRTRTQGYAGSADWQVIADLSGSSVGCRSSGTGTSERHQTRVGCRRRPAAIS